MGDMEAARVGLVLRSVEGLGDVLFGRLVEAFGSASAILGADPTEARGVEGAGESLVRSLAGAWRRHTAWADAELARVEAAGWRVLGFDDPEFPELLRAIPDPPPALWVRGDPSSISGSLAVVGSRRASPYGLEQSERFASALASLGVVIASGLARGIDGRAHEGALLAGGRTVAVLGCGLDVTYPREHAALADRIADSGAILTEHPLGTPPLAGHFPRRNRVLAGISWGVLVVEATARSGSLITAELAADYGREVFAIPGRIDSPTSRGTNDLLKDAAHLVSDVSDLARELPAFSHRPEGAAVEFEEAERRLVEVLGGAAKGFDDILREAGLPPPDAAALLTGLTVKGVVEERPGNRFRLRIPVA